MERNTQEGRLCGVVISVLVFNGEVSWFMSNWRRRPSHPAVETDIWLQVKKS